MSIGITSGRTIHGELQQRAAEHPERTWLISEAADGQVEVFTWASFLDQATRTARVLRELGVRPGDRLLLMLHNSSDFLLLWFAAAQSGAIVVPVNPASSDRELDYLCDHSGAVVIAALASDVERAEALRTRHPRARHVLACGRADQTLSLRALLETANGAPVEHHARAEDAVAVLYTSGTTSRPKGCVITHANYLHAGEAIAQHISLRPDDRQLVVLPYFHGNAQYYSTMPSLVTGASIVVTERFSASRYFAQAARHGATVGSLFAAPMRMILAQPQTTRVPHHTLRLIYFAQSLTPGQLAEWDRRFGVPLMQIYGMTEQLGHPLANPLYGRRDNMTIGRPTLAYTCRIVDDMGRDVADSTTGQLLVSGVAGISLMQGYYRDEASTAAAIRDGWLWTGDNVRRRADGFVEFVDRSKDMIKRSGENVAASEVEAVIKDHPAVFDTAVIGIPDPVRDEAIKAFVVLKPGAALEAREIVDWCAARLARFRVPEQVEFRDELPRTSVGKIQKNLLRQPADE